MKFLTLIVVSIFAFKAEAQKKDTTGYREKLIGESRMKDSRHSVVKFKNMKFNYLEGRLMATYDYKIERDTLISIDKNGEVFNWLIETVTNRNLTLRLAYTDYRL